MDTPIDASPTPTKARFRALKIILVVAVILTSVLPMAADALVTWRTTLSNAGLGAVDAPDEPTLLETAKNATGRFTAHLEYTSALAARGPLLSADVVWDDDWFFQNPTTYNHELATTCCVLSAIANVESAYYQVGSGVPAYMEQALAQLGFEDISTASYRYRSEILDEVVNLLSNSCDVAAYSIASKRVVSSETGEAKTLLLVTVRGTYGTEWISNVNLARFYGAGGTDHEGFADAADEILEQLRVKLADLEKEGIGGEDVAILFCGHSRGGAASNVAAALADDAAAGDGALVPAENIYAYTFACPNTTLKITARDATYDNIFNIINPGDIVPRLPLASWGYKRYGIDLTLPQEGDEGFDEAWQDMQDAYLADTGTACEGQPSDVEKSAGFEEDLGARIPTQDDIATAGGITSLIRAFTSDGVVASLMARNHENGIYIAWMQATDAATLEGQE